jgi:alpha-D-xyloside xylohydrolase
MKKVPINILLLIFFLFVLPTQIYAYEKQPDGVLFEIKKKNNEAPKWMKIQVCADNIIRVIATPVDSFSTRKSLMVSHGHWSKTEWSVKETGNDVEIKTLRMTVKVNQENGVVAFYDQQGNQLLQEKKGGGKIFTPGEVLGEKTYHIRNLFESPPDEAFYGLGAHQNGIMNYKGHDIDLWQYNIVDVNPFLISSKNYGILWDNNSKTKMGDIREYESISGLSLYGKDGRKGGLTAEYFIDKNFDSLYASRLEPRIEYEYLDKTDKFPTGFAEKVVAVRWSGEIECKEPGLHKIQLFSSGYIKMWIDGNLVVDAWRQNWLPWTHKFNLDMQPGKRHSIKIEWIHTGGYIGLKYLTPEKGRDADELSLYSDVADQIDYYFILGKNIDEVIGGYRTITGTAPMMPKWAMGLWQCRERYKTQDELLDIVKEFRKRHIPLDNIVQDWFYWPEDKWGDHDFDKTRYPDVEGMVNELHNNLNTHIMISVWPKFYVDTKNYDEMKKRGFLYMRNVEKKQKDWVGPGYISTFYDPYSESARELYWAQINKKLFPKGFDGWWLDSTEPDLQSDLSPEEILLRIGPTALGSSARYLNTYSLVNSQAVYEGQRKTNPDKRVFILTRSAFAGQQRYATATWSGDVATRWEDLKNQIPAGLNFCLAGIPYWTTDIGGFATEPRFEHPNVADLEEWREFQTRWFQYGAFCPLFRVHGEFPFREMFNIAPEGHPAYETMLAYDKLRYRLMPYIYSLTGSVTRENNTIMRALVMDFGNDKKVLNITDQFMFGPCILVNPVTGFKARKRSVYLPEGCGWFSLKEGTYIKGGQVIEAAAPYSDIPLYVKEGSVLLCGPAIEYTTQKPADTIRAFVYTGSDCSFTLYEDENINYNYENGKYALIPFHYSDKEKTLTIETRSGEFKDMLSERVFEIVWISKENPSGLDFKKVPAEIVKYNGAQVTVRMK